MRLTSYFLPTVREVPAEAEVISHQLMIRAGMIRKVAAGVYSLLPFGLAALRRFEHIVRREMNHAGAQEVFLPALQPAELWQQSGRWEVYGKELMRLVDRHDRQFCLGPTHEEVVTSLVAGEVRSWRGLPLNLYQIQTKFRDEIRPRFGVMRGREFSMKDAYSFDRDEAGAEESYRGMYAAYIAIFQACGLAFRAVEADSGPIGGSFSHEFMVLAETGEDAVLSCSSCSYAANMEKAELPLPPGGEPQDPRPLEQVETPGRRTIEEVASFLQTKPQDLVKTILYVADGQATAVLVRGDHQVNETKLLNYLKVRQLNLCSATEIEKITSGPMGFSGPVGLKGVAILADRGVERMTNFITGGNRADLHLRNVNPGRDFTFTAVADLRQAEAGDSCPRCGQPMQLTRGIEVGHVFKLGTKYSEKLGARFLDEEGKEMPMIMGCYGIGMGRTVAACVEQNHDENGIIWPLALAPFQVIVTSINVADAATMTASAQLYDRLRELGWDVLWDDREERPGVKFKDADLIGIPYRLTVGPKGLAEGTVELRERRGGVVTKIPIIEAATVIDGLLRSPAAGAV